MDIDGVRAHCLSLSHTTEQIQWEDDLIFKVGGKMYAVLALEPGDTWLSFKCSDENFAELIERPGVIPAPYMARAQWIALESGAALPRAELQDLLAQAHALVFAKLPKHTQMALAHPLKKTTPHRREHRKPVRRASRKRR